MITLFEKYIKVKNRQNLNSVSPEFWEMVKFANWQQYISVKNCRDYDHTEAKIINDKIKKKLYTKYEYSEIENFSEEYEKLYNYLYLHFKDTWLNPKYSRYMPSDDGYSDLLSSIIGKGRAFVNKCLNDKDIFVKMAKDDDFAENFGYLLNVEFEEYDQIRSKYDDFYRDRKKFNL